MIKKNGQKETKESKLSLGSWLAFWAANMICNQLLYLFFKLRNKLPLNKLQISFIMLAKEGNLN